MGLLLCCYMKLCHLTGSKKKGDNHDLKKRAITIRAGLEQSGASVRDKKNGAFIHKILSPIGEEGEAENEESRKEENKESRPSALGQRTSGRSTPSMLFSSSKNVRLDLSYTYTYLGGGP